MSLVCASGFSTKTRLSEALEEACDEGGIVGADLCCVFVSATYGGTADHAVPWLQARLGPRALVGCTVQGVIGRRREVESGPGVAVWSATLPKVEVRTFLVRTEQSAGGFEFNGLPRVEDDDTVLLFPDPFSTPLLDLLAALPPQAQVIGGVASGSAEPGGNRLFQDDVVTADGCAGVLLRGAEVRAVVSQGCRPIGRPFVVTQGEENVVRQLAGKPAFDQLQEVLSALPSADRDLAQHGLHLGCAIDEYKESLGRGDFVIRNLMGVDPKSGALAVTDRLRVGQTVQFHVRDGRGAREDFEALLQRVSGNRTPAGALLFSCNGRGARLFGEHNVDAEAVARLLDDPPVAGFFAGGEIGPVGGVNFVHGFTASAALLYGTR